MFFQSIKFKRNKDAEWESGYYIGKSELCKDCVILDKNYKPILKNNGLFNIWEYRADLDNRIQIFYPEKEEDIENIVEGQDIGLSKESEMKLKLRAAQENLPERMRKFRETAEKIKSGANIVRDECIIGYTRKIKSCPYCTQEITRKSMNDIYQCPNKECGKRFVVLEVDDEGDTVITFE